ncbi:antitoxin Xre/MbcA/ParS toxin-binding domain-containing protein [Halomonas sp. N3-2A]|uniref:antitoxin Xre/MbcA/ParS toxin-binding domain-containing protein n=1 Tax=Halomonas sp. N3-2A TaxID=2014541 RepID=UPI000B5B4142|nr:antitoxin Xre/MbcA/ParS toxin-binding domain-containing protein [Halomonas sp. N3-2A]ASK21208.1 antitoxin [Halomonas sp. N3-2A]
MAEAKSSPKSLKNIEHKIQTTNFWKFIKTQGSRTESQRLKSIHDGFSVGVYQTVRVTFQLQDNQIKLLFSASTTKLDRYLRKHRRLDSVSSERLDRIATASQLVLEMFGDKQASIDWLSRPNEALGGQTPIMMCDTEIGAKQARRVLHAMNWGGVA